jgi:hypothetical protein
MVALKYTEETVLTSDSSQAGAEMTTLATPLPAPRTPEDFPDMRHSKDGGVSKEARRRAGAAPPHFAVPETTTTASIVPAVGIRAVHAQQQAQSTLKSVSSVRLMVWWLETRLWVFAHMQRTHRLWLLLHAVYVVALPLAVGPLVEGVWGELWVWGVRVGSRSVVDLGMPMIMVLWDTIFLHPALGLCAAASPTLTALAAPSRPLCHCRLKTASIYLTALSFPTALLWATHPVAMVISPGITWPAYAMAIVRFRWWAAARREHLWHGIDPSVETSARGMV